MTPRLNDHFKLAPAAIGAINTWNRLQVGFRALHAVEESRDAA